MSIDNYKNQIQAAVDEAISEFCKKAEEGRNRENCPIMEIGQVSVRIGGEVTVKLPDGSSRAGNLVIQVPNPGKEPPTPID